MLQRYLIKRFHRTSFRSKLVLTYVLLIVIPVISALFINGAQLFRQTQADYEDILAQLNSRTNVTINDFFTNLARNSFFYLTDNKLYTIMDKTLPTIGKQNLIDVNTMQTAMEQFVLINGNIVTISAVAPNGSIYGSKPERAHEVLNSVHDIGKETLQTSSFVVHVPDSFSNKESNKKGFISIVRYMSDLNLKNGREGYAKIEVYFRAIENMLGGISNNNKKLGTIVLAGSHVIYDSNGQFTQMQSQETQDLSSQFGKLGLTANNKLAELEWNDEQYLVSGSINPVTGWTIVQYIPSNTIMNTFIGSTFNYILFGLLVLIAALSLAYFFHRYFVNPILKLSGTMKLIDSGHLHPATDYIEREDEVGRLVNSFNQMIHRLKASRESEITAGNLQKKTELKMLQAQINPHFLYNTLNAIHSISELHRLDEISVMTKCLSGLYRYNIKYGDEVTLEKELEQIDNYVKIQQIRFLNRFQVEYRIDPEVLQCKILKFLIQPIIENCFYHGLEPKIGSGTLTLTIRQMAQSLYISVKDDGVGMTLEKLAELTAMLQQPWQPTSSYETDRNYGLRNVHTRIKHFYGESYWMKVSGSEHEGTTIVMNIPMIKGESLI